MYLMWFESNVNTSFFDEPIFMFPYKEYYKEYYKESISDTMLLLDFTLQ